MNAAQTLASFQSEQIAQQVSIALHDLRWTQGLKNKGKCPPPIFMLRNDKHFEIRPIRPITREQFDALRDSVITILESLTA